MADWRPLPASALAAADQWYLTTLEDVVDHAAHDAIIDHAFRYGHLVCEATDPFGETATLLVLNVKGPELTLTTPTKRVAFAPEQYRHHDSWIMTFASTERTSDFPPLPPGPLTLVQEDVRIGDTATITTSLRFSSHWRDWAWAWTPTYGPAILNVIVDASDQAIDAWFDAHASRHYVYTRTDEHWGRRFDSRFWDGALIRLYPRTVSFIRGYTEPPPRQLAADRGLLEGLIAGALPVEGFDVIDGDYIVFCATGYSKEDLASYLNAPKRMDSRSAHPWTEKLTSLDVDASDASDEAGVATILAAKLGLPDLARLAQTSLATLPRSIEVWHSGEVAIDSLAARVRPMQPRIQWRWSARFPNGTRTIVS